MTIILLNTKQKYKTIMGLNNLSKLLTTICELIPQFVLKVILKGLGKQEQSVIQSSKFAPTC